MSRRMSDAEYRRRMDALGRALRDAVEAISAAATEDDMAFMAETITRAETVGHLFTVPLRYGATMDRLTRQRQLLTWARDTRKAFTELAEAALNSDAFTPESRELGRALVSHLLPEGSES